MAGLLCGASAVTDVRLESVVLDFLVSVGVDHSADEDADRVRYSDRMRAALPLDALKRLLRSNNDEVCAKAMQLERSLYPGEDEDGDEASSSSVPQDDPAATDS
ncbi:unnamed protein product [Prorocentrum cordatum]|uniref:LisH domain-containing protein n=1 Tax=Prorocentrum cordatum TaxID=2364126 RepID=A0ABN9UNN7_9DINO|nr:unnamed protein product [Polarella glacialis]